MPLSFVGGGVVYTVMTGTYSVQGPSSIMSSLGFKCVGTPELLSILSPCPPTQTATIGHPSGLDVLVFLPSGRQGGAEASSGLGSGLGQGTQRLTQRSRRGVWAPAGFYCWSQRSGELSGKDQNEALQITRPRQRPAARLRQY